MFNNVVKLILLFKEMFVSMDVQVDMLILTIQVIFVVILVHFIFLKMEVNYVYNHVII